MINKNKIKITDFLVTILVIFCSISLFLLFKNVYFLIWILFVILYLLRHSIFLILILLLIGWLFYYIK